MNRLQRFLGALVAFIAIASLSACGTQPGERAISGALVGAAAGGLVFALFPGTPVTLGLATGGSLGAIAGGLSLPEYLYMGEPVWTQDFDPETMTFSPRQQPMQAMPPSPQAEQMLQSQQPMQQQQLQPQQVPQTNGRKPIN